MIFLGNAIQKRWHTWVGRLGEDKVIAGTSGTRAWWEEGKDNANGAAGDVEAEQSWELSFN